jgi:hypothetical protein
MIFFLFVVSEDTNQIPLDHKPSVVIDNQPLVNEDTREDMREDSEDEHQGFVAHHLNDQQSVQHQVNQDFLLHIRITHLFQEELKIPKGGNKNA